MTRSLGNGGCEVENTLARKGFGGEVLTMTWNGDKVLGRGGC